MSYKEVLLDMIFDKTGIYVTNKNDCKLVSQIISKEKTGYLSESTLYRFFLYPKSVHKPYLNTLNSLALFCGFPTWNYFTNYCDTNFLFKNTNFLNNTIDRIINDLVQREKFSSLLDIYDAIEHENYKTKEFIGLHTFKSFITTNTFPLFIKKYGHHKFIRNILMESLYDPHHRINGYTESFHYYLGFTNLQMQNYLQDFIFGNSILFRYYFKNKDAKAFEIGKKLYENEFSPIEFNTIHLFPKVRFLSYKIWFLNLINADSCTQNSYLDFCLNWIQTEFKTTNSIIDTTIIYQTFIEVFEQLKLNDCVSKINLLQNEKVKIMNANSFKKDLLFSHNANGLLNIFN